MAARAPDIPKITITLSIEPSKFPRRIDDDDGESAPVLAVTATSHAAEPITIFTWPTLFHLCLAQQRRNFTCGNLTTNTPVRLETTKAPRRYDYCRNKGGADDDFFVTLKPGKPVVFQHHFVLASRGGVLEEGHRYRFAVAEGELVRDWWYGTRHDILVRSGRPEALLPASGPPIPLNTALVEFEVAERADSVYEASTRSAGKKHGHGQCSVM